LIWIYRFANGETEVIDMAVQTGETSLVPAERLMGLTPSAEDLLQLQCVTFW
jgi:hypothetical protein